MAIHPCQCCGQIGEVRDPLDGTWSPCEVCMGQGCVIECATCEGARIVDGEACVDCGGHGVVGTEEV